MTDCLGNGQKSTRPRGCAVPCTHTRKGRQRRRVGMLVRALMGATPGRRQALRSSSHPLPGPYAQLQRSFRGALMPLAWPNTWSTATAMFLSSHRKLRANWASGAGAPSAACSLASLAAKDYSGGGGNVGGGWGSALPSGEGAWSIPSVWHRPRVVSQAVLQAAKSGGQLPKHALQVPPAAPLHAAMTACCRVLLHQRAGRQRAHRGRHILLLHFLHHLLLLLDNRLLSLQAGVEMAAGRERRAWGRAQGAAAAR